MSIPLAIAVSYLFVIGIVLILGRLHAIARERNRELAAINAHRRVVDLAGYREERAQRVSRANLRLADRYAREFDHPRSFPTRLGDQKEAVAPRDWPTA